METQSANPCAICLGDLGRGKALFTAECSHVFHHRCISDSVAHGNRDCPLCKATWRDIPAVELSAAPQPPSAYADDEETVAQGEGVAADAAVGGEMVLRTHCEVSAVARDASRDGFAVLVHARAPAAAAAAEEAPRAALDLITVLDVSGSMSGHKLEHLKQAMAFVIDNLGPADRLSAVSFADDAVREIGFTRMSGDGKASARRALQSLDIRGGTNIGEGLRMASEVLAGRRYRNAVTSVILLSDGQDTYISRQRYMDLVPSLFTSRRSRPGPIHTFGFGTDHDAAAMHTIAEATCGTFSVVENHGVIQDSFAQCVGGLLSVVAQDARVAVECVHPGVRIREVKSGHYESTVDADGRAVAVDVGELYAEEERRFLLFVDVPRAEAGDEATHLLKVRCTYRDVATGRAIDVAGDDAVVQRPVEVTDAQASMEVERERVRVAVAEDIAAARAAAERGEHAEAGRILELQRAVVRQSAPRVAGDEFMFALEEELEELEECMEDEEEYEEVGRARVLKGMSSHAQQRASFAAVDRERECDRRRRRWGRDHDRERECDREPRLTLDREREHRRAPREPAPQPYMTAAMQSMLMKSARSRAQQEMSTPPPPPPKRKRGSDGGS